MKIIAKHMGGVVVEYAGGLLLGGVQMQMAIMQ